MSCCQQQYEITHQQTEPSWIKLQTEAHKAGCTLCHLLDEAVANGGILPVSLAREMGLPIVPSDGDSWVGAESKLIVIYGGQQFLVG